MPSGVEFDEDNLNFSRPASPGVPPSVGRVYTPEQRGEARGMAGWLVRHGIAKSGSGAQVVLIGIVIVNAIITFVVIKFLL